MEVTSRRRNVALLSAVEVSSVTRFDTVVTVTVGKGDGERDDDVINGSDVDVLVRASEEVDDVLDVDVGLSETDVAKLAREEVAVEEEEDEEEAACRLWKPNGRCI